jgi:hypothetical protein
MHTLLRRKIMQKTCTSIILNLLSESRLVFLQFENNIGYVVHPFLAVAGIVPLSHAKPITCANVCIYMHAGHACIRKYVHYGV